MLHTYSFGDDLIKWYMVGTDVKLDLKNNFNKKRTYRVKYTTYLNGQDEVARRVFKSWELNPGERADHIFDFRREETGIQIEISRGHFTGTGDDKEWNVERVLLEGGFGMSSAGPVEP